jgi:hypothetical protein
MLLKAIYHISFIFKFFIILKILNLINKKINNLASFIFQFAPTILCQAPKKAKYTMHIIAYLSRLVKYDTVGSDLFITHLKETDVSKRVNVF